MSDENEDFRIMQKKKSDVVFSFISICARVKVESQHIPNDAGTDV